MNENQKYNVVSLVSISTHATYLHDIVTINKLTVGAGAFTVIGFHTPTVLFSLCLTYLSLSLRFGLLLGLFVFGENVVTQLVRHVNHILGSARRTLVVNGIILDFVLGLGESTVRAQDEFLNVAIDEILQDLIRVRTIDNSAIRF
jgi:hypothetical protein